MSHFIEFNHVTPFPLIGVTDLNSQVWNKELFLNASTRYLLYAPSGKGKSSFIHLIYGLRNDFEGTIRIMGKESRKYSSDDWAQLRQKEFSIQFQDLRLFPDLTAYENLMVKAALKGSVEDARLNDWMEVLQIKRLRDKPAKHLSYGERQRFAILRAIMQPFQCLLLDEPFAHLDPENTRRACELIDQRCKELNAGFILTSLEEDQPLTYDSIIHL